MNLDERHEATTPRPSCASSPRGTHATDTAGLCPRAGKPSNGFGRAYRLSRSAGLQVPRKHPRRLGARYRGAHPAHRRSRRTALSALRQRGRSSSRRPSSPGSEDGIHTAHIAPGQPWQNGTNESFNDRLRDECLDSSGSDSAEKPRRLLSLGGRITTHSVRIRHSGTQTSSEGNRYDQPNTADEVFLQQLVV